MNTRFGKSLSIAIIALIIAHVLLLILGMLFGTNIGIFGISMLWPHWHTWGSALLSIVAAFAFWGVIYAMVG